MSLISVNWRPSTRQLRTFGMAGLAISTVAAVVLRLIAGWTWLAVLPIIVFGLGVCLSAFVCPRVGRRVYVVLVAATLPIGIVLSASLLTAFYVLLVVPIALVFRLIGRDPMCRRIDPDAVTYWLSRDAPPGRHRYFQQF